MAIVNIHTNEDVWIMADGGSMEMLPASGVKNFEVKKGLRLVTQNPVRPDGTLTNQSDPFMGEPGADPGAPGGD